MLTARDFYLAQIGLFGLFRTEIFLVARRPVRRLFFLGLAKEKYLDLEIVTNGQTSERGAVVATVRCFTFDGREVFLPQALAEQTFFADTKDTIVPQRLWVQRPPGAIFALVTIRRTARVPRIGMTAHVSLKSGRADPVPQADMATSRDRLALERTLKAAKACADRVMGRKILARLIYLWQSPDHMQELAMLEDAEKLTVSGFKMPAVSPVKRDSSQVYIYAQPLAGKISGSVSLSKWLQHEARLLERDVHRAGAGKIELPEPNCLPEMLIAAEMVVASTGAKLEHSKVVIEGNVGWLSNEEIAAHLVSGS